MKKDIDSQFLCKDCERYNLCQYYDRRKEDSYICKYFHLPNVLDKIRAEIESIELLAEYTRGDIKRKALEIIDKYMPESEETDDYYKGAQEEY